MNLRDKLRFKKSKLLGDFFLKGGDVSAAAEYFEKTIEINPEDEKSHYSLGFCYFHLENIEYAEEEFRKVLELNLGNDNAWMKLGALYQQYSEEEGKGTWYNEIGKRINGSNEVCKNPPKIHIQEIIEKYSNFVGVSYAKFDENKNISFVD
ncbi:MAG: tetratricopeptide repeat protein [Candidatus Aenigmarchaeota archaeon]|nr:tetratricopeptide repeat protein [Candidatus Aenigmarchaeota archaeon]